MKLPTYKDFDGPGTVCDMEVEFTMKSGESVYVDLNAQTVKIDETEISGKLKTFYLEAAAELVAEEEESKLFELYGYQDNSGSWELDRRAIAQDRINDFLS